MSELLPCPFCGGEAEIGYPLRYRNDIFTNQAACSKCGAAIYGEGIAANGATTNTKKKWNTRAERTCHFEPDVIEVLLDEDGNEILDADGNEIETGEPAEDCSAFECSECGYPMLYDPDIGWFDYCEPYKPHFKYCPNCGAKVSYSANE